MLCDPSLSASKIPSTESSIMPMMKQLNSVEIRSVHECQKAGARSSPKPQTYCITSSVRFFAPRFFRYFWIAS